MHCPKTVALKYSIYMALKSCHSHTDESPGENRTKLYLYFVVYLTTLAVTDAKILVGDSKNYLLNNKSDSYGNRSNRTPQNETSPGTLVLKHVCMFKRRQNIAVRMICTIGWSCVKELK
jgi:hypothetical protein